MGRLFPCMNEAHVFNCTPTTFRFRVCLKGDA